MPERRSWRCPNCSTKWAIPADAIMPERCPKCPAVHSAAVREAARFAAQTSQVQVLPATLPRVRSKFAPLQSGTPKKSRIAIAAKGFVMIVVTQGFVVGMTSVFLLFFQSQYRESVRWNPLLSYSPEIPVVRTAVAGTVILASMIPVWISFFRGHRFWVPISILSVFTSWTCLGWIGALMWACWPSSRENNQ